MEQTGVSLVAVGMKADLIEAKRTFLTIEGRDVLIVHHKGALYAIDCYCYHAGSSLENGDIEEIDSRLCIVCPKHKYRISLSEGEGLYRARDRTLDPPPLRWFSKGVKQRVHELTEQDGAVFLRLSQRGWVESDYYQGEKGRLERAKTTDRDEEPGEEEA